MSLNGSVVDFTTGKIAELLGNGRQARYIQEYLTAIGSRTCIIEEGYVDKDYLIDYQKFYCRSFEKFDRYTKRLHFFSTDFSQDNFEEDLIKNDKKFVSNESYLGFVVVKPIRDKSNNPLIGRTILKTYPAISGNDRRHYIKVSNGASLFGINLNVESLPFQAQDRGVSACATVALWTVTQAMSSQFEIQKQSPAEITELSTLFPSQSRTFPQHGLTLNQMISFIRMCDLDFEYLGAENNEELILTAIKAYSYFNIPLIAIMEIKNLGEPDYHAAVITGYKSDANGKVIELYVHDDQFGPYCRVKPNPDFLKWNCHWSKLGREVELQNLLIPIYHKIRLPFIDMFDHYSNKISEIRRKGVDLRLELFLTSVQDYKADLITQHIDNKSATLKETLPKFIWVERVFKNKSQVPFMDTVFDGTAIHPRRLLQVIFQT